MTSNEQKLTRLNRSFFIDLSTSELAGTMAHVCVTLTTIVKLQQVTGGQLARCSCHPGPSQVAADTTHKGLPEWLS